MKFHIQQVFVSVLVLTVVLFSDVAETFAQALSVSERAMTKEKVLNLFIRIQAPLDSVWSRWSDERGLRKFFAPACRLEPRPLGRMDVFFAPDAPPGQRGAENNLVLVFQEKQMISFTWDCPPQWPEIRKHRTTVAIRFYPVTKSETLVTLSQTGWGLGAEWQAVYNYFGNAWAGFVLPNLKYSLEVKPVDWTDFPKNAPKDLKPAERF